MPRSSRLLILLLLSALAAGAAQAQRFTLSGYVQDARTGERLPGATLYAPGTGDGTTTNAYGFFSLTLREGAAAVRVSYVGYVADTVAVALNADVQITVELEPEQTEITGVEVEAERDAAQTGATVMTVPIEQIQKVPALMGEVDLLKAMQLLPGVKSGSEGSGGLYVRGGGPDQNLILLDGTPVYNAFHLFGFLSVFNADAVKRVDLIKGGFPARYGGRLSSVVDIALKEGNLREPHAQGSIGLVSSKLTVEAPLRRDRTSFILSGRRTYLDLLARPFMKSEDGRPTAYFYDLNAKLNHVLSPRDWLYLSVYAGDDRFGADTDEDYIDSSSRLGWGNTTSALRWNHLWSPRLFMNVTLTYSDYALGIYSREEEHGGEAGEITSVSAVRYDSGIREPGARADFDFVPSPRHYVRFGAGVNAPRFTPGALALHSTDPDDALDLTFTSRLVRAVGGQAYAEDDVRLTDRLKVNVGLHTSAFQVEGRSYGSVEPRLAAQLLVGPEVAVTASLVTMRQYLHLLSTTSGLGLPTDLWVPATDRVRPQRSWQAALGASRGFGTYAVSLESYYKEMSGLLAYREGASFINVGTDWQDLVTSGQGRSYGVELFVQKKAGRTTGWLGYTLARTTRQFAEIGRGLTFPDRYDRRHDLSLVVLHRVSRRLDASLTWVYATGNAVTIPVARYGRHWHYGDRLNSFRMPAYHRADVALSYYFARSRRESALTLSVYNAYNRRNPFFIEFVGSGPGQGDPVRADGRLKGYALFPVIPALSYSFKF